MATQNSVISYVPQPFFIAGSCAIAGESSVDSIENEAGIFDPRLSNYTTVVPDAGVSSFSFQVTFAKQAGHLAAFDVSVGLIGCALLTYEDDLGTPDLDTEFSENIACYLASDIGDDGSEFGSFAHNSQDGIKTFCAEEMPSIISGGRSNLVFHNVGTAAGGGTAAVDVTIERAAADVAARPHARFVIGHLFVGVDLPVIIDPLSYAWTLQADNQRFVARDYGAISSDGTLVKRCTGEFIKIENDRLIGSTVSAVNPIAVSSKSNFFDLVKVNTSYPLLFNSFPLPAVAAATWTAEQANLSARQNFFSIYGFMDDPLETLIGDFRNALASEFKARFRITETR